MGCCRARDTLHSACPLLNTYINIFLFTFYWVHVHVHNWLPIWIEEEKDGEGKKSELEILLSNSKSDRLLPSSNTDARWLYTRACSVEEDKALPSVILRAFSVWHTPGFEPLLSFLCFYCSLCLSPEPALDRLICVRISVSAWALWEPPFSSAFSVPCRSRWERSGKSPSLWCVSLCWEWLFFLESG